MPKLEDVLTAIETKLDNELGQFTQDMIAEVKVLRLQGLDDETILNRLVDEFTNQTGIFKELGGRIGTVTDFGVNATANLANAQTISDYAGTDMFEWIVEPTAEL